MSLVTPNGQPRLMWQIMLFCADPSAATAVAQTSGSPSASLVEFSSGMCKHLRRARRDDARLVQRTLALEARHRAMQVHNDFFGLTELPVMWFSIRLD